MKELPLDYLNGLELGQTRIERELEELAEYRDEEAKNPHTTIDSKWTWGKQFALGANPDTGEFRRLPSRAFVENFSVRGAPGTGKTSRVLLPLTIQAIHNRNIPKVIFVHYKQSPATTATLEIEGRLSGRRVRRITNVPGKASYGLPLLPQIMASGMPSLDVSAALVDAMGYSYGAGHGEDFYRDEKEIALAYMFAAEHMPAGDRTFVELARRIMTVEPNQQFFESFRNSRSQLMKTLCSLASANFINCQPGMDDAAMIDARKFATSDTPELLIVEMVPEISRELARLVPQLMTMLIAQAIQSLPETTDVRIFFVVDEASNFFSQNICNYFERFRSRGVAFVYAFHHAGQLKNGTLDYSAMVEGNTATKAYLSCDSIEDADFLQRFGGKAMRLTSQSFRTLHQSDPMNGDDVEPQRYLPPEYYSQMNYGGELIRNVTAEAIHNTIGPSSRFSDNDILGLLSQEGHGFIRSTLNRDLWLEFGTMVPIYFDYCVTARENKRRRTLPWITDPGTIVVSYADAFAELLRAQVGRANVRQGNRWRQTDDGQDDRNQRGRGPR